MSADENDLDSSDESESDENIEAARLYHRRKSTAIAVRARVSISRQKWLVYGYMNKSILATSFSIFVRITALGCLLHIISSCIDDIGFSWH